MIPRRITRMIVGFGYPEIHALHRQLITGHSEYLNRREVSALDDCLKQTLSRYTKDVLPDLIVLQRQAEKTLLRSS